MGNNESSLFITELVDVDNNQILQNEVSLGRWIFKALILLLEDGESCDLEKHIRIERKKFQYIPDIYLEKGCKALQIEGRTIIEIKKNLLFDTEIRQSDIFTIMIEDNLVDNILIVYINSNQYDYTDTEISLEKITLKKASGFITQIKEAIRADMGMINRALSNGKKKRTKTWTEIRNERLANAKNDFQQYDSVIFVGAGVSSSAGLPDWNYLLKNILTNEGVIVQNDFDSIYKGLGFSNLITARYIQKSLHADDATMIQLIRKLLYPQDKPTQSALIEEICKMIKNQENVKSVISYNYDTLIEDFCNNKLNYPCYSVYKNNHNMPKSFPVYHVHGVIFRNNDSNKSEGIVLGENNFHRVYSEVFDWSNVEQLHALTRCTCFFIGLSMKDPNLRRLLDIAQKNSGKAVRHYVFLERTELFKNTDKCEKDFQTREDLLADLGLNVIWYKGNDNHKELPELLKSFTE